MLHALFLFQKILFFISFYIERKKENSTKKERDNKKSRAVHVKNETIAHIREWCAAKNCKLEILADNGFN